MQEEAIRENKTDGVLDIKLGAWYKTRDYEKRCIVEIIEDGGDWKFRCDAHHVYTEKGTRFRKGQHFGDLVKETEPPVFSLEVGKTYVTRGGKKVRIIEDHGPSNPMRFLGNDRVARTQAGFYYNSGSESRYDIIEEYKPNRFKVEVGGQYRSRDRTEIVTIIDQLDQTQMTQAGDPRVYVGDNGEYYSLNGRFNFDGSLPSPHDLISREP